MLRFLQRLLQPAPEGARVLLLRRQPDPTDDIYIEQPLRALAADGRLALKTLDFGKGWSPRALLWADYLIVSRYILPEIVRFLRANRGRFKKIVYLFDDDLRALKETEALPPDYRKWLAPFVEGPFEEILALADDIIVTSPRLEERYASPRTRLLEPVLYLGEPPANLSHYDRLDTIEMVCALTSTHRADLLAIAPVIGELADRHPRLRVTFIGCEPPEELKRRRNIAHVPQMPWPKYKRFVARLRAHISLAPLWETAWNQGKSTVKLIDAAQFGAVPVMSDVAIYRRLITDGVNGVLVANHAEAWRKRLGELIEQPQCLRPMAAAARQLARETADPARARAFWAELLA